MVSICLRKYFIKLWSYLNMLSSENLNQIENRKLQAAKVLKGEIIVSTNDERDIRSSTNKPKDTEFCQYERKIANRLGYADVTLTRFHRDSLGNYSLKSTTPLAQFSFWGCTVNLLIKLLFLGFLLTGYFGPIPFLDQIAALDYMLCGLLPVIGTLIFGFRYPLHEIIYRFWTVENSVFRKLGYPSDLKADVEKSHRKTINFHLAITWVGCPCLAIQFLADPKYCGYTYAAFTWDTWWLRAIFCFHEFIFMLHACHMNLSACGMHSFIGTSLSSLLERMTRCIKMGFMTPLSKQSQIYSIDQLVFDYKQLMILTERLNDWLAWKTLVIHVAGYCQFISDVFVLIQVLKSGGGIEDVWFYLEDCIVGVYIMYRVYKFMALVVPQSEAFLRALYKYLKYCPSRKKAMYTRNFKGLRIIALRLGPVVLTPITVLASLDIFGQYYVCVALWNVSD